MSLDPYWFPTDPIGRIKLAFESLVLLVISVCGVFNWPPAGIVRNDVWAKVFTFLLLDFVIALIPLSLVGLCWAIAMPEWIERFANKALRHMHWVFGVFMFFALATMLAAMAGLL